MEFVITTLHLLYIWAVYLFVCLFFRCSICIILRTTWIAKNPAKSKKFHYVINIKVCYRCNHLPMTSLTSLIQSLYWLYKKYKLVCLSKLYQYNNTMYSVVSVEFGMSATQTIHTPHCTIEQKGRLFVLKLHDVIKMLILSTHTLSSEKLSSFNSISITVIDSIAILWLVQCFLLLSF